MRGSGSRKRVLLLRPAAYRLGARPRDPTLPLELREENTGQVTVLRTRQRGRDPYLGSRASHRRPGGLLTAALGDRRPLWCLGRETSFKVIHVQGWTR